MANKWTYSIFFLFFLLFLSSIISLFMNFGSVNSSDFSIGGNVLVIPVKGVITSSSNSGMFSADGGAFADDIIDYIQKAKNDDSIKAVVFDIDSPGGGAVASQEIVQALKGLNKTKISVIRNIGASGAYWIASATNYIFVNVFSTVGSIGVYSSYLEFSGLLDKYNVTYERLVSGKYKDMGSIYKDLTDEERQMLEKQLSYVHDYFIDDVAQNLKMKKEELEPLAQGQIFIGKQAIEKGLVDAVGNMNTAKTFLEKELNTTVTFKRVLQKESLSSILGLNTDKFAFHFGQGFASWIDKGTQKAQSLVFKT